MMSNRLFIRHSEEIARARFAEGVWNGDTAWGWLDEWAARNPDRPAVIEADGRTLSYGELSEASRRFANALLGIGIVKGDIVAIQLPSSTEFLIAYFGVTRMGGVLATLHMPYREGEIEPLLRFSEARAIICGPATEKYDGPRMMERLRGNLPALRHIIVARGEGSGRDVHVMSEMIRTGSPDPIPEPPSASDPALMCFTSGTSSAPKAVIHAFETLMADARTYVTTIATGGQDRSMIAPPFTHIFGLECVDNIVFTGGAVIPLEQFTPERFAAMLHDLRPTIVYGAPAHLAATLKSGALEGRDLSSVTQVILGGSICPPHVAREFEARLPNGKVGILFGMTETLLVTQTPFDAAAEVRHGTIGSPVPGIEARIVDGEGNSLADGEEGELQLRGYTLMAGYVGNDAANARAFTPDGWFRTGDLACRDRHGNISITGRLVDVINRGGVKINPSDVESVIAEHDAVVDAALVPMPDDVLGERICAVVTLVRGARLDLEDLCAFLERRKIAKLRWPERIVVVDSMPMTPTKKIIKGALRRQIEGMLINTVN
jgi:acyl-CoA synthetase (AMP-forming)/AMP-acid ligase II